jgi:hypothetical protein
MVMIPRRPGDFHALPGPFTRSWKTLAVDSVAPLPIGNSIARGVASTHDARDEAGKKRGSTRQRNVEAQRTCNE